MSPYMTRQIQKHVDIRFCKQTKHYLRNLYKTSLKNKHKIEEIKLLTNASFEKETWEWPREDGLMLDF